VKVGWLADEPGYIGGAELTQAEFRAAAPEGVEVIDCCPGDVAPGLDRYVAHNVVTYLRPDFDRIGGSPITWYHHDLSPWVDPEAREWLDRFASHIVCSPAHRDRYGRDGECIPPALDLARYQPTRQINRHRKGTCSLAGWRARSKGTQALGEWAMENGPVDVYGDGDCIPAGTNLAYKGPLKPEQVASTLQRYERFVFLPVEFEPFCRTVVEAWAAGCRVITNGLIGARYYIDEDLDALESAADDFWGAVL
jgi:hypothetical protein